MIGRDQLCAGLEKAIALCEKENTSGAFLLLSVENLATVISAYGHDISEKVMLDLMGHIAHILDEADVVARVQRDQIAAIIQHSYPEETERLAQRLINVVQNYGRDQFITASLHIIGRIGCAHFPNEAHDVNGIMDAAYIALHNAKPRQYTPYVETQERSDMARQQMGLANYFYNAYKEDRLRLAWQPVIAAATGEIVHYEGLLRLVNAHGRVTSAGALIPVAEQMGLIEAVDMMVLDRVIDELEQAPNVTLALNVSNVTTESTGWLNYLHDRIGKRPDVCSRMIIEITETAVHRDLRQVAYFVASLQSLGCSVALDDFGSGYTSFRQLKALSVDMIKIDGIFVSDLAENADNRFFVRTLLDFTQGFGLKAVAEFVENGETAKILMEMGIDYMQGYYFGRPGNHRRWLDQGEYSNE